MTELPLWDDFERIVLENRPMIDTRAPVEFARGAFPGAVNLPLMSDEERAAVGTCYKHQGNAAAVRLGHELVNETVRRPRIAAWAGFLRAHPDALLYCFRGGQRSEIAQRWLYEYEGLVVPRLRGGYKALRRWLIERMEGPLPQALRGRRRLVLGGLTGAGKTLVIREQPHSIDLEGLAHHRGSAFGRHIEPQPPQIGFENALAWTLIRFLNEGHPFLLFEDEGRNIGSVRLPVPIHEALYAGAERVILEVPFEERLDNTLQEYVIEAQARHQALDAEGGLDRWHQTMRENMDRIRRRLGGARHAELVALFEGAWRAQQAGEGVSAHREWIAFLLTEYYDPMYRYQIGRSTLPVAFQGDRAAVRAWLREAENA